MAEFMPLQELLFLPAPRAVEGRAGVAGRAVKACCVTASAAHPAHRVFLSSGAICSGPSSSHLTPPPTPGQGCRNFNNRHKQGPKVASRPPHWSQAEAGLAQGPAGLLWSPGASLGGFGTGKTADVSVVAVLGGTRPRGVAGPGPGGWGVEGSHLSRPWSPQGGWGVCGPPRVCAFVSRLWGLLARRGPRPWVCSS